MSGERDADGAALGPGRTMSHSPIEQPVQRPDADDVVPPGYPAAATPTVGAGEALSADGSAEAFGATTAGTDERSGPRIPAEDA